MSQPTAWSDISLHGVIDFHVHAAMDNRPRWYTASEMAQKSHEMGMEGFILKNHHTATYGSGEYQHAKTTLIRQHQRNPHRDYCRAG